MLAQQALQHAHVVDLRSQRAPLKNSKLIALLPRAQDQEAQVARKKRRSTTRTQARSIVGASLEVLLAGPSPPHKSFVAVYANNLLCALELDACVHGSWQVINKKRTEKPEVRKASREAALREVSLSPGAAMGIDARPPEHSKTQTYCSCVSCGWLGTIVEGLVLVYADMTTLSYGPKAKQSQALHKGRECTASRCVVPWRMRR